MPMLQGLIENNPDNLEFRTKLAALYHQQGDTDAAENVLRSAVADMADDIRPKRALVRYLSENRDLMIAQVELAAFIKNDPDNAELKMLSAGIFEKTRDFDRAENIYHDIIKQNSTEPVVNRARYQLARLLLDMKRIDESRQQLAELLKDNPNDIDALSLRGMYALNDGDIVMARRGEVGRIALVTKNEDGWLCGTGSFVLRFSKVVARQYLKLLFRCNYVRNYLAGEAVGMTMVNLNHGILKRMPIAIPPLAEQHRIVAKVDELMALCDQLKSKVAAKDSTAVRLADAVVHHLTTA